MNIELMPWQTERDPEKALEKIFDVIAKDWFITEEPFDGTYRRRIMFTLIEMSIRKKFIRKSMFRKEL